MAFGERQIAVSIALVAILVILAVYMSAARRKDGFSSCTSCGGNGKSQPLIAPNRTLRRGDWVGGRGPYNLQLYDNPYYYPYYETRDYADAWDRNGRCAVYCSASGDGGCTVTCR